jgi:hypothetical protein
VGNAVKKTDYFDAILRGLLGAVVLTIFLGAVLFCYAGYQNYTHQTTKLENEARLAKVQVQCGEYGNGRAWSVAKRKDFLMKNGGGNGR